MPWEATTRRGFLREVLAAVFDIPGVPLMPNVGPEPTERPCIQVDVVDGEARGETQEAGDAGDPIGPVVSHRQLFQIRGYVSVPADTNREGLLDKEMDALIEAIDIAGRQQYDIEGFEGEGYRIEIEALSLNREYPAPDDERGEGRVVKEGYITYLLILE